MIGSEPGLNWVPLGRLLVDGRVLTQEQLDFALGVKVESGKRLGEIVVDLGFTTERAIAGALAEQYELEYVDLAGVEQIVLRILGGGERTPLRRRDRLRPHRLREDDDALRSAQSPEQP
jgi:hypothetical protein